MPIKVQQPDGRYSCRWLLPDLATEEVFRPHGEIILEGSKAPLGKASGKVPGKLQGGFPENYNYEYLNGQLSNGAGVLMITPRLEVWGQPGWGINFPDGNAKIYGAAALVGHGAEHLESADISEIRVQVSRLDRIIKSTPIESRDIPVASESNQATWSVTTRSSDQYWDDGATRIHITYMQSATVFTGYEFGIRFTPILKIKSSAPVPFLEAYDRWVRSLYRVMSVITGKNEDVTYLEVKPAGADNRSPYLQVFARPITQSPYMPERGRLRRGSDSALWLDEDGVSLLDLVKRWHELECEQNPIVYTYDPFALGADQHPRARFLLLIQALEGISSREARLNGRVVAFEKKRARVLSECMKHLTGMNRRFVKGNLKKSPINLDDRLTDMFGSLPINPIENIGKTELIDRVSREHGLKAEGALRLIRNDLAHGNRTYDVYELAEVSAILEAVVRAHALRILGMSDAVQERVLAFDD
ncbi:HEPN domain-containing protein [Nocardia fusca]|uniref:ApeA N-terminal domain 1-containing protein n=1 Tax=Nocardia fusca TaxID=941183 RepID=UPI0012F4FE73|nr:HEPN domain-containing protein [Nocardia fusca]